MAASKQLDRKRVREYGPDGAMASGARRPRRAGWRSAGARDVWRRPLEHSLAAVSRAARRERRHFFHFTQAGGEAGRAADRVVGGGRGVVRVLEEGSTVKERVVGVWGVGWRVESWTSP